MRFLLDEHISRRVAVGLRKRRIDAVAITEPERRHLSGLGDSSILELATQDGRSVVTYDYADFSNLHRTWVLNEWHHSGIVLVPRPRIPTSDIGALVRALVKLGKSDRSIDDQMVWLEVDG